MIALMVEDSALVRSRLIPMLAAFSGVCVVASVDTTTAALDWLRDNRCDCVLLDLSLPGGSGVALLDALERGGVDGPPPMRVVLTNGVSDAVRRHCASRGAAAVFDKSIELDQLFAFLRRGRCTLH
ncbi:MAG: response regulator [Burkholderiales bacterium]|jgi:DNA-binding NarL/FixJ family response regulator